MAKKINDPENNNTEKEKEVTPETNATPTQEKAKTEDKVVPAPVAKSNGPVGEIPDFVKAKLKLYSMYKTLYVDSSGGTFTADTPENIRGKAILYENPYHKP